MVCVNHQLNKLILNCMKCVGGYPFFRCSFGWNIFYSLTYKKKSLNLWFFFPIEQVFSPFSMYNKCLVFLVYLTCSNGPTKSNPSWINHAYYLAIVAPNWSCLYLNIFLIMILTFFILFECYLSCCLKNIHVEWSCGSTWTWATQMSKMW